MKSVCECGKPAVMWGFCDESVRYFLKIAIALNVLQFALRLVGI